MNEINVGLEQMRGREHAFYVYQHFLDPHGLDEPWKPATGAQPASLIALPPLSGVATR